MEESKLCISNFDVDALTELLEQNQLFRYSTCTVSEVINKVTDFTNFLNSIGRMTLMHSTPQECQELLNLFLTLKKNIKAAVSEMGHSCTKKVHNYICSECECIIQVPPSNDIWKFLQNHEHFEQLYSDFLDGKLQISDTSNICKKIEPAPSTSQIPFIKLNDMFDTEHTDSGIDYEDGLNEDEEPLGSNTFRFNFKPTYDESVEAALYPDSFKSLGKLDTCPYATIQKANSLRAVCLICHCFLLSESRVNKKQCVDHVLGQRHVKASKDVECIASLENYHELFLNLEPCYQAHQVYFEPKTVSMLYCELCQLDVPNKSLIDHIHKYPHKNRVLEMYYKKSMEYYLLNLHVLTYGIKDVNLETEKPKGASPKRENLSKRRSTSEDKTEQHTVIRSYPKTKMNVVQDFVPNRLKEHLQYLKDRRTHIACDLCRLNIRKDVNEMMKHILTGNHNQKTKTINPQYNYYCEVCDKKFKDEFAWDKHFTPGQNRHMKVSKSRLTNLTEYECITCKTVIFGDEISITRHQNKGGKRREQKKEIKLPEEVKRLFASRESIEYEEHNEDPTWWSTTTACVERIEAVLSTELEHCKAYPFGSRVSGLGNQDSDLDLFIDTGEMYFGRKNQDSLSQCNIVKEVAFILGKHKEEFTKIITVPVARTPIVKVQHIETGLDCDLSFRHGLSVENTKFLRLCLGLQPITRSLILILKKWLTYNKLTEHISTYGLAMLSIFYLQVNGYLLSVKQLKEKNSTRAPVISGWETIRYTVPLETLRTFVKEYDKPLATLLMDFFKYYADFNYFEDTICPLLGHTIKRKLFQEPQLLPPEMNTYVKQLNGQEPEQFRFLSPFCIQDPFDLSHNLTKACQSNTLSIFRTLCLLSYKRLEALF